jgi:hypothetical protein
MNTFSSEQVKHGIVSAFVATLAWLSLVLFAATAWGSLARTPWTGSLWVAALFGWSVSAILMLRKQRRARELIVLFVGGAPSLILFPFLASSMVYVLK